MRLHLPTLSLPVQCTHLLFSFAQMLDNPTPPFRKRSGSRLEPTHSCLRDHEPTSGEEDRAAAKLGAQFVGGEIALVDVPARAVVEDALLNLDGGDLLAEGGVDDDKFVSHPARLSEEGKTVSFA